MDDINQTLVVKLQKILNCKVILKNNIFKDEKDIFEITSNDDGTYTVKEVTNVWEKIYKDAFDLLLNIGDYKFAITYGRIYNSVQLDLKVGSKDCDFDVDWVYKRVAGWDERETKE